MIDFIASLIAAGAVYTLVTAQFQRTREDMLGNLFAGIILATFSWMIFNA